MGHLDFVRTAKAVRGMTFGIGALTLYCAATSMAHGVGPFSHNLIDNPNADSGPAATTAIGVVAPVGWVVSGNFTAVAYGTVGMPDSTTPGAVNRGTNFFAGGPNNALSSASQNIDLSSGAGVIDTGHSTYTFSGWLGGNTVQDDSMILSMTFNDAAGGSLGTVTINGPTSSTRGLMTSFLARS